jgi:hypothetical protein
LRTTNWKKRQSDGGNPHPRSQVRAEMFLISYKLLLTNRQCSYII